MSRTIKFTSQFKKDVKLMKKQGKNLDKLFDIVEKLAKDEELNEKHKDHNLSGNYHDFRECHIEPDWLLIYFKSDEMLVLVLQRTGSHSDLFN